MRRAVAIVVVAALVLAGALFVLGGEVPRSEHETEAQRAAAASPSAVAERSVAPSEVASTPARERVNADARAEREELRRRILEAQRARERAAAEGDDAGEGGSTGGEPSATTGPGVPVPRDSDGPEGEPAAGGLIDRTGDHEYLVKVMNEDLMPLADECYALARETQPELAGMLVLDFEILGEEEIGGVVESVELGQANELVDPNLVECMRESILATTLPAPEQGGRDAISISLRLSPDDAE